MGNTITIPVTDETITIWLISLLEGEIKEAEGAASNERLWANGSDGEDAEMHLENARLNAEYAELLKSAKADAEKFWEDGSDNSESDFKSCKEEAIKTLEALKKTMPILTDVLDTAIKSLSGPTIITENMINGLDEGIRCAMCTNPMANNRGCDGMCKVDETMYKKVLDVINNTLYKGNLSVPTSAKAKWEVLEKHSDGTTRCRCTKCKNTMNLSIHTFDCFNYCPNCGKETEV